MIPTREQIGMLNNTGEQILENLMDIRNYFGIRTRMLTVTCLTDDDVPVTGQTVTVRSGSADGEILATAAYEGEPVTFRMLAGMSYYVSASDTLEGHFLPSVASGVLGENDVSVTIKYYDLEHAPGLKVALNHDMDLTDLVGSGKVYCNRGGDTLEWDVVDYNGQTGEVTLMLHDLLNVMINRSEGLIYFPEEKPAGSYYFTSNGTNQYFTVTEAIPADALMFYTNGTTITYHRSREGSPYSFSRITCSTDAIEGAEFLGTDGSGNLNLYRRVYYGSNNFGEDFALQWLNSDKGTSYIDANLVEPVTKFQRTDYFSKPGFLSGMDGDFVDAIAVTDWKCRSNTVYETPVSLGGVAPLDTIYTVRAKFALPSLKEITGSCSGHDDGTTQFGAFVGASAEDRIRYGYNYRNELEAMAYKLRSNQGLGTDILAINYVDTIRYNGNAGNGNGNEAMAPVCKIRKDA